ncbi:MAG TPA: hypothetical protein VGK59_19435 [Ohtaekwangia sp.]
MMKLPQLLFILTCVAFATNGQGYIILINNQKIEYDKFKSFDTSLLIDVPGKKGKENKRRIDIDSVFAYYGERSNWLEYKKPAEDSTASIPYQFIARYVSGKINLYRYYFISRNAYTSVAVTQYFIEKEDKFERAYTANTVRHGKEKTLENLKRLVSDNPDILKTIDDEFNLNEENLLDVVRRYNLAAFEYPAEADTTSYAEVVIYKRLKSTTDKGIKVQVNGKDVAWPSTNFLTLKVPLKALSKVCIGGNKWCELIEGLSLVETYYKIVPDTKTGYSMEKKLKHEALTDLKMMGIKPQKK